MHWGLYTCYVQELVAEAATKVVWKALHLVLLKDDKWALAFTIVKHSVGEFSCQPGPVYVLSDYPQGKYFKSWYEHTNVYLRLQIWATEGNSDNTTLERPVELAIVDIDLSFVTKSCSC